MRVLFVMAFPGFLRYFDSTIRLMGERGHTVHLAFNRPYKELSGLETLSDAEGDLRWLPGVPDHDLVWGQVGRRCRTAADFVRYLSPDYADSPFLRMLWRSRLEPPFRFLGRWDTVSARRTRRLMRILGQTEAAIPSSRRVEQFLEKLKPDVVVVTPFVTAESSQVDLVKSAQALGIPTCACIASWDNLTTKGWIRLLPDLVAVWNDTQKEEASQYHNVPSDRVVVTGAPAFDKWFDRAPRLGREAFCQKVGIRPDVPFVLFLGSSEDSSPPAEELIFVRKWLQAVRQAPDPSLRGVGVVIRPHPFNSTHWQNVGWANQDNVRVYPDHGIYPTNRDARSDYFDSMYHAAGVVGINTTALIEAAILGRTVHTILATEFATRQTGTLHFRYLLPDNGGFLQVATTLDQHLDQLTDTLRHPDRRVDATDQFVNGFLRPHGRERAATPLLVDAIERLAARGRHTGRRMQRRFYPLRVALLVMGWLAVTPRASRRRRALSQAFDRRPKIVAKKWLKEMNFRTARSTYQKARRRRKRRKVSVPTP